MDKQQLIKIAKRRHVDWELLCKECYRQHYDINKLINWSDNIDSLKEEIDMLIINGFWIDK